MTVQEFQAKRTERIAEALAHFVATTREDRLNWEPPADGEGETRGVLEQVEECIIVNGLYAGLLRGEAVDREAAREKRLNFVDVTDASAQLTASGREVAEAIRALSDGDLTREFPFWRGPVRGENLIEMPYRNMCYHCGQVNFIQTLYGDQEFHVPPAWL
jgi:hypothetical protein